MRSNAVYFYILSPVSLHHLHCSYSSVSLQHLLLKLLQHASVFCPVAIHPLHSSQRDPLDERNQITSACLKPSMASETLSHGLQSPPRSAFTSFTPKHSSFRSQCSKHSLCILNTLISCLFMVPAFTKPSTWNAYCTDYCMATSC